MDISNRLRDIDGKLEGLAERLGLRDEILTHLKASNELLQESVKAKWTFVQALVGFVTFVFALTFGYELYKVKEVRETYKEAKEAVDALQKEQEEFRLAAAKQALIIAHVAAGSSNLSTAYREYNRSNYSEAAKLADEIIATLQEDLKRLDEESVRYRYVARRKATHDPTPGKDRDESRGTQTLAHQNLVAPLELAVRDVLVAALTLKARSLFYGKNLQGAIQVGERLQKMAPERWEGYHFVGVGTMEGNPQTPANDEVVRINLEKGFEFRRESAVDALNLGEFYFMRGNFRKSREWVAKYEESSAKPIAAGFNVVVTFYRVLDDYLLGGSDKPVVELIEALKKSKVNLGGTYSAEGWKPFFQSEVFKKLSAEKQARVRAAIEALSGLASSPTGAL